MIRSIVFSIGLAMCGLLVAHGAESQAPQGLERFAFVAMGCMPYGKDNYPAYERLLAEINRRQPAFTVHCGDAKKGDQPPTDEFYAKVRTWFDSLEGAVIYTPGDNDWTDVHRKSNGRQDPLVWLAKVRAGYFAEERSFGRAPIPLVSQRRDPAFAKFVENVRWTRGGVVFATVHVVGSNNNHQPEVDGALDEFRERNVANAAWISATFSEARATNAPAVGFFFHGEAFLADKFLKDGEKSGFTRFRETLEAEARAFGKPVLLVNADEHRYRLEPRFVVRPGGEPLPNVTRLATFGEYDIHATFVMVDPAAPEVFLAGPLIVPGNPLPVLPRPE